jgi:hypothetical protein
VRFNQTAANNKPQSGPRSVIVLRFKTLKRLKKHTLFINRYPNSFIPDTDNKFALVPPGKYFNFSARGGIFNGIIQQIMQNTLQTDTIGINRNRVIAVDGNGV